jgi:hypothetical protein
MTGAVATPDGKSCIWESQMRQILLLDTEAETYMSEEEASDFYREERTNFLNP